MIIPQDNATDQTVVFKDNVTKTYVDLFDNIAKYYNVPHNPYNFNGMADYTPPYVTNTTGNITITKSDRYNASLDEYRLFDFCIKLRDLFKEHFEQGDVDISDDEFWEIIKA